MKITNLFAAALAISASATKSTADAIRSGYGRIRNRPNFKFENHRPSKHRADSNLWGYDGCTQSSREDGLPRGYPGAKLARKAMLKQVAVKHPRGLRLDGATV